MLRRLKVSLTFISSDGDDPAAYFLISMAVHCSFGKHEKYG